MLGVDPAEDLDRVFPLTDDDREWDHYFGKFGQLHPDFPLGSIMILATGFINDTIRMTKTERAQAWKEKYDKPAD